MITLQTYEIKLTQPNDMKIEESSYDNVKIMNSHFELITVVQE